MLPPRLFSAVVIAALLSIAAGCVKASLRPLRMPAALPNIDELWIEPTDLEQRDLYLGVGGQALVPDAQKPFTFVALDTSGHSKGYDVRDAEDREWSVKLGPEAQSEVVASRVLWAIGFHQPPTYYVTEWTLEGQDAGVKPAGRFRPELSDQKAVADWKFDANPFVGTRPFSGLLVGQLVLNNWDLKPSNNKLYEVTTSGSAPKRMYVVRDLGASLGSNLQSKLISWMRIPGGQGTKNDLPGFEKAGFIEKADESGVDFAYRGVHEALFEDITAEDVHWTCELMSRIADNQWNDAFRAGGYTLEETARYVAKIKSKVTQGLQLRVRAGN